MSQGINTPVVASKTRRVIKNLRWYVLVLFLLGMQSTFFGPIKYSLIPNYTPKEKLIFANAMAREWT